MNKNLPKFIRLYAATLILCFFTTQATSQCVLINEVIVNASGACDGACVPSTAEWVELFNTCDQPIDLGCYVLTDGDFSVTIPAGTVIPANGFLMIGSSNSGTPVNIDWGTCGCTSGPINQVGIFTNSNEQLAFTNSAGEFQDAIYWGAGQFAQTPSFTTNTIGTCASITIPLSADNPMFQALPSQGGNDGFSLFRSCDGNLSWQSGGTNPTPGASNGTGDIVTAALEANSTSICSGSCVDFTDASTGTPTSWTWQFPGSNTPDATGVTVLSVCYNIAGNYDAILTVANACGSSTVTLPGYIVVAEGNAPDISTSGPTNFCEGGSVTLTTSASLNLQWYENDVEIPAATGNSIDVTTSGTYYVTSSSVACIGTSQSVVVQVTAGLEPMITNVGSLTFCNGDSVLLQASLGFGSYQWYLNGQAIPDAFTETWTSFVGGEYAVEVSSGTCNGVSPVTTVAVYIPESFMITPDPVPTQCPGDDVLLAVPDDFNPYQWTHDGDPFGNPFSNDQMVDESGDYQVSGVDANGCSVISQIVSVNYFPDPDPQQNPPADTFLCDGETTELSIDPIYVTYQWRFNGQNIPNATSNTLTASQDGNYSVIVTTANGCSFNSNVISIDVLPPINVNVNPQGPVTTCTAPLNIQANIQMGNNASWQWFDDSGPIVGQATSTIAVTNSGNYYVVVTNQAGCEGTSSTVAVTINTSADILMMTSNPTPCEGEVVQLSFAGSFTNILWSNNLATNTINVTQNGTYSVQATDVNGCVVTQSTVVNFTPLPVVNAGMDTTANCVIGVTLNGMATGTYSWSPSLNLSSSTILNPVATPTLETIYTLTATINGCTASDQVRVIANCSEITVPNVFSPNGDGLNDTFEIASNGIATYAIAIFNRWGKEVYHSTNPNLHWSGKVDGSEASDGTYYYIISALDANGKSLIRLGESSGKLTLLR